jgi:hypothetical protein
VNPTMPHKCLGLFQARHCRRQDMLNGLMVELATVSFVSRTHNYSHATTIDIEPISLRRMPTLVD